jgi:ABC-2 type transport system ATP-binding protein
VADGPLIAARDLVVRYRTVEAVRGISLAVHRGEVVGLIGPDGAGKTSTLRVLAGLLRATGGHAEALGVDCWSARRALHRRLGYLAQRFALYGDLTVDENVQFFALMYGVRSWRARRDQLLELVGLTPFRQRAADHLSGGMKQKLALACTLIHSPEVLLLDEPTTGVDPVTRRELWRLLAELVAGGLTLVVATPYLDEAERCTRVALIDEGRILTVDSPDALREAEKGVMVEVLAEPRREALTVLRAAPGVAEVEVFGERLHASLPGAPPAGAEAAADALAARLNEAGLVVHSSRPTTPSLEDVFIGRIRAREAAAPAEVIQ